MHFKVCLLPFLFHRARITAVTLCSHDTHAIPGLLVYLIVPWINLIVSWGLRLLKVCCLELMLFPVTTIKSQLQQRNKTFNNPSKNIVILFHKNLFIFLAAYITLLILPQSPGCTFSVALSIASISILILCHALYFVIPRL